MVSQIPASLSLPPADGVPAASAAFEPTVTTRRPTSITTRTSSMSIVIVPACGLAWIAANFCSRLSDPPVMTRTASESGTAFANSCDVRWRR